MAPGRYKSLFGPFTEDVGQIETPKATLPARLKSSDKGLVERPRVSDHEANSQSSDTAQEDGRSESDLFVPLDKEGIDFLADHDIIDDDKNSSPSPRYLLRPGLRGLLDDSVPISTVFDIDKTGTFDPKQREDAHIIANRLPDRIRMPQPLHLQDQPIRCIAKPPQTFWSSDLETARRQGLYKILNFTLTTEQSLQRLSILHADDSIINDARGRVRGENNWPYDDANCREVGVSSLSEANIINNRFRNREERSDEPDGIEIVHLGMPAMRGCKGCWTKGIGQDCSLVHGSQYPCEVCDDEGDECDLFIEPDLKSRCTGCKREKLTDCCFDLNPKKRGSCQNCQEKGWKCMAGPKRLQEGRLFTRESLFSNEDLPISPDSPKGSDDSLASLFTQAFQDSEIEDGNETDIEANQEPENNSDKDRGAEQVVETEDISSGSPHGSDDSFALMLDQAFQESENENNEEIETEEHQEPEQNFSKDRKTEKAIETENTRQEMENEQEQGDDHEMGNEGEAMEDLHPSYPETSTIGLANYREQQTNITTAGEAYLGSQGFDNLLLSNFAWPDEPDDHQIPSTNNSSSRKVPKKPKKRKAQKQAKPRAGGKRPRTKAQRTTNRSAPSSVPIRVKPCFNAPVQRTVTIAVLGYTKWQRPHRNARVGVTIRQYGSPEQRNEFSKSWREHYIRNPSRPANGPSRQQANTTSGASAPPQQSPAVFTMSGALSQPQAATQSISQSNAQTVLQPGPQPGPQRPPRPARRPRQPVSRVYQRQTVKTRMHHPIRLYERQELCSWCKQPWFGWWGSGEDREIEVDVMDDGQWKEVLTTENMGDAMCGACTFKRRTVLMCPEHQMRTLPRNSRKLSFEEIAERMFPPDGAPAGERAPLPPLCAVCMCQADKRCQVLSPGGSVCGLALCDSCCIGLGACDGKIERLVKDKQKENGVSEIVRADAFMFEVIHQVHRRELGA